MKRKTVAISRIRIQFELCYIAFLYLIIFNFVQIKFILSKKVILITLFGNTHLAANWVLKKLCVENTLITSFLLFGEYC